MASAAITNQEFIDRIILVILPEVVNRISGLRVLSLLNFHFTTDPSREEVKATFFDKTTPI